MGCDDRGEPAPANAARQGYRSLERVWARFGLITEVSVRFVSGHDLRFVGALLILPALVAQLDKLVVLAERLERQG
jgi:hypothetical protein